MLGREEILRIIDAAYAARMRGDKAAVAEYWDAGATYRLAGETSMIPALPLESANAMDAVSSLIDLFHFHRIDRLDAVVEGLRAAVHWRVTFSTWGGERVEAELFDLWQFSESGKIKSLLQFTDTAMLMQMLA